MLRVLLVRHGETEWNKSHRVQGGASDIPLNETGRKQAEALGLRLKKEEIQAIYSSPLKRALDTAQAIAQYHQLEIGLEPDLRELDVGELEGVAIGSVGKRLDELLLMRGQGGLQSGAADFHFSKIQHVGGESLDELQQRSWGAMRRIAGQHSDGAIVVVSHYFVTLSIICAVLDLPVNQIGRFRLSGGSLNTIVFDGSAVRLTLFSDVCHLT